MPNRNNRVLDFSESHIKTCGYKTTQQLAEAYNEGRRWTTDVRSLAVSLARDPRFKVVERIRVGGSSRTIHVIWGLR